MNNIDYSFFYTKDKLSGDYLPANGFDSFRQREYKKGDYIASKGERVNSLSIVVEGSITVEFVIDSGLVIRSIQHTAPTMIGAMALLTNEGKYLADTIANEDTTVLSYSRLQIEEKMQSDMKFMYNFISFITSRVENLSSHLATLAQKSIKAKVAYYIFLSSNGVKYRFSQSIGSIANYLCVERPSLSRVISQMVADGLISYKNGEGEILNPTALKELL